MTRPFTEHERRLLDFLVANDPEPSAAVLRAQIAVARFREPWFEGSQSFDIELPEDAPFDPTPPTMSDGRRISPGRFVYLPGKPHTEEWFLGELFLWIIDGKLDSLEYPWFREEMPDRLPELDQLGAAPGPPVRAERTTASIRRWLRDLTR